MTTTDEQTARPRITRITDGLLLPDGLSSTPPEVAAANSTASAAWERYTEARAAANEAKEALRAAPHIDRRADAAASASGQPLPEERATDAARRAFTEAERVKQASGDAWEDAARDLAWTIIRHRDSWANEQTGIVQAARADAKDALSRLARALDALDAEKKVASALATFPVHGGALHVNMGRPTRLQPSQGQRRAKALDEIRASDHVGGTFKGHVQRDAPHLLAAMLLLVED